MQKITFEVQVVEYESVEELSATDRDLLENAKAASGTAYAPYSKFHVGAALLLANGAIVTGSNQENAAYPSGLCAERVAMFAASAKYPDVAFESLAIYACSETFVVESPAAPCGGCRQVMAEYEHRHPQKLKVTLSGQTGKILQFESVKDLLPMMFTSNDLIK